MLDSERLRSFVTFSETMNFTRAAEARNISQPALFAQVAKLTDEVGAQLYVRDGRRLLLTDAGRRIEAFGRELIARTAALRADLDGRTIERVVMAAGAGAYLDLLGEGLRAFLERAPSSPEFLVADAPKTLVLLQRGVARLGVVAGPIASDISKGLDTKALATVPMMVAMPRHHPLAARRRIIARHLRGVPLVVPPPGRPVRAQLDLVLQGIDSMVAVEASGWPLMLEFVRMGLGVAIVNGNVRLPSGLVARRFSGLPPTTYTLATMKGSAFGESARLAKLLFTHRNAWRQRPRTAWSLGAPVGSTT